MTTAVENSTPIKVPPFPVAIFMDSWRGATRWVALRHEQHLHFPVGDDEDEINRFWAEHHDDPVGYGPTPDAALAELLQHRALTTD